MKQTFKRFGPRTEKIISQAKEISSQLSCSFGSDCLIASLGGEEKTLAGDLLKSYGFQKDQIFDAIKNLNTLLPAKEKTDALEIRQVIQEGAQIAFQQRSVYIEPEFLLMAILTKSEFSGYQVLEICQIDIPKLTFQLREWLVSLAEVAKQDELIANLFAAEGKNVGPVRLGANSGHGRSQLRLFSRNLTNLAKQGQLDRITSRETELRFLIRTLLRRNKNNPVIVGEPGIGKTALVEGLASEVVKKRVPAKLINKNIYALDLARLVAGTSYRGQFEERITAVIAEAGQENAILFIDELHAIMGTGSAEGALDVAQILKPALVSNDFAVIGATTYEEYRKYIEKDKALSRRFSPLYLNEPTKEETLRILENAKAGFEEHHGVTITDKALAQAVELAERFIPERFFPDKALDLIDEAASIKIPNFSENQKVKEVKKELAAVAKKKLQAVNLGDYGLAKSLREAEDQLQELLILLDQEQKPGERVVINHSDVAKVVSERTALPLNDQLSLKFSPAQAEKALNKTIFGQKPAIKTIITRISEATFRQKDRGPVSSFIFIGPSGTGKTETARLLARELFGSERSLIKFDMSEFSEKFTVSSLIGAPAGYVGYDEGGKLTNAVRKNPYSVILFDEIEKSHSDVSNLLLQILEDGYLTDNVGRKVNFQHTIIILTSNIANELLQSQNQPIGFRDQANSGQTVQISPSEVYLKELTEFFSPELMARFTNVVIFQALKPSAQKKVIKQLVAKLVVDLGKQGISVQIDQSALDYLLSLYNPKEGARSLRKVIDSKLLRSIMDFINLAPQSKKIKVGCQKNSLKVESLTKK